MTRAVRYGETAKIDLDRWERLISTSTQEVFSTMLGTDPVPEPAIKDPDPIRPSQLTALIALAGELAGCVSIHCTHAQGRSFAARLLGVEPGEISSDEEIEDAVGEIVNMIGGSLRTRLAPNGTVGLALPSVLRTPNANLRVKGAWGVVVPFADSTGTFYVEFVAQGADAS